MPKPIPSGHKRDTTGDETAEPPSAVPEAERWRRVYEAIISSTPDLVYAFDLNYRFTFANRALLEMWGRTLEESLGKSLLEIGYEPWHAEMHEREIDQVIATKQSIRGEVAFPHATLGRRLYDYIFVPVLNAAGDVEAIAGTTRDITDRQQAEERVMILAREVDHRSKNLLAVIQSIAHFTQGDTVEAFKSKLNGRITSLAHAHSLLSASRWQGADLRTLVEEELAPYRRTAALRVGIEGQNLTLSPAAAQGIAMALHELATNAAKYGAFARPAGHIAVRWSRRDDGAVELRWAESGGPPVSRPEKLGFGLDVVDRLLRHQLEGTVRFDWDPAGLVCELTFPLR